MEATAAATFTDVVPPELTVRRRGGEGGGGGGGILHAAPAEWPAPPVEDER
jgi:hypothetical protein